jgi:VWFA-related protein
MHRTVSTARLYGLLAACVLLITGALLAAQQAPPQNPPPQNPPPDSQNPEQSIRVTVDYVSTPAWVYDRAGDTINGLRPEQFRLFDNGKEQNIQVDVSFTPISLVLCLQANSHVEGMMPQLRKIGNLVKPLLIGDQGEAAVIAYHRDVRVLQDFTNDADKITMATSKIFPGADANRMIDAVSQATRMLRTRPRNRQRIILLVGETRDNSSETRLRSALMDIQVSNIIFYSVDMSRFITTLTAPPSPGRQENRPAPLAGAATLPPGVPATPTTVAQANGGSGNAGRAEFIPLLVELYKDAKAIFKNNPVEAFTKATGGKEYGFHSQRTLEQAVQDLGEQLHSNYVISYSPNNRDEAGWHEIKVDVPGRPDVKRVQTRPGYWLGAR